MAEFALSLSMLFIALGPGSDVRLDGVRLQRFLETGGTSEIGRDVSWKVPGLVFAVPRREQGGHALFVTKRIGLVVPAGLVGREEVERRGGFAVVRGRVERVPEKKRKKGDPEVVIVVREIARRRLK